MGRVVFSILRRIGCDNRGAVLLTFTIAILPLLRVVVAVAVDLSQILLVKQKLTNAVDAAAIAVGRHPELADTGTSSLAEAYAASGDAGASATRTMLENCATPQSDCPGGNCCYYHSPSTSALEAAFSSIALGINQLRLAR